MSNNDLDGINDDDGSGALNTQTVDKRELDMISKRRNIYMNTKNANDILSNYDKIMRTIEKVQKTTA